MSYLYSLRLSLDPGRTDEAGLGILPELIGAGRIDDVMVFANVEELNTGHTDDAERVRYRNLAERVAKVAVRAGATMSINPWHTLMHGDYGKRLGPGQDFRLMVDPQGRTAELAVCPRDPAWREYIAGLYAYYAAARPRFLWVEDDFRYHNHAPLEWGGCFCEEHLAEFSRRAGHRMSREEFVAGMLATGEPHPYRQIWLETAREGLEEAAAAIREAVHAVSPETRLGLMTSVPAVHAAEGRRWGPLLAALSGPHPPAVRVHLPSYVERRPADYLSLFHTIADAHRALLPPGTEVYPELENFPYSRFSKSLAFTRFQLLGAQTIAPAGMTLDFYDLNGNGPVLADGYQDVLAATRQELDAGLASGVFARPRQGVTVLVSEDSAATLHTRQGRSPEELYPRDYLFGALLGGYGIPFHYATDTTQAGGIIAVSGQYFRSIGVEATRGLLQRNRALLDAEAVETLLELGLGHLAGAASLTWTGCENGAATYEEAVDGLRLLDRPGARASILLLGGDVAHIDYRDGRVRDLTRLRRMGHEDAGHGHVVVGDRILVMPFGRIDPLAVVPAMLRTTMRQELLQRVLGEWDPELVFLRGAADAVVYSYPDEAGQVVYLVNGSLDPLARPRLRVGERDLSQVRLALGRESVVDFAREGDEVRLELTLPPLEAILLRLS